MEKFQHIVGVDLSKKTIDMVCHQSRNYLQISNDKAGFKQLLQWFKGQNIDVSKTILVMEHTGLYSFYFGKFLQEKGICFTKVNALAIKNSMGLVRGKSDKTDTQRIAYYGFEKQNILQLQTPANEATQRLAMLLSTRERLVKQKVASLNSLEEYRNIGLSGKDIIMQTQTKLVEQFKKQIDRLKKEMDAVIESEEALQHNYELLQTIKGVGKVAAMTTLVKTNNFSRFSNARKFACYCGTAPFEHSSGSSIRGQTRVSQADKRMKTILDLCAKSAIQYDRELREYYQKRVAMGKSKMSSINVVRNKIIYRMFAVIKRQTPFVENCLQAA